MKLTEIASDKTRIFGGMMPNGNSASFIVKFEGVSENGAHIWLGKMKAQNEPTREVALAVGDDGVVIAMNFDAPADAVREVFAIKQKAFGPSLKPNRNWRVRGYNGTKLENYS